MPNPDNCPHSKFQSVVAVHRLEDVGKFMADVRIYCLDCGVPFRFLGLQIGLNLSGATTSVDSVELRAAIAPGSGLAVVKREPSNPPAPPAKTPEETGH